MLKFIPRRTKTPDQTEKKVNVNPSLPKDSHDKLYKLSVSCSMSKTKMAEKIITMAVNHPDIINYFQDIYNEEPFYRITPIVQDENTFY